MAVVIKFIHCSFLPTIKTCFWTTIHHFPRQPVYPSSALPTESLRKREMFRALHRHNCVTQKCSKSQDYLPPCSNCTAHFPCPRIWLEHLMFLLSMRIKGSHLSKRPNDLKNNDTLENKPFSGSVLNDFPHGVFFSCQEITSQKRWFLELTHATNWVMPH